MKKQSICFIIILLFFCINAVKSQNADSLYKEKYRPQFHFSPKEGWIGDPSGFVYYQGKYQMFWWGKVISDDLVHYKEVLKRL